MTPAALGLVSALVAALGLCIARSKPRRAGWAALVVCWSAVILIATLTPVYGRGTVVELVPLRGPLDTHALGNLLANVSLFAPLGLLLGLAYERGVRHVIWCAAAGSAFIEFAQWSTGWGRSVDTTDVIANVLGAAVGGMLALRVASFMRRGGTRAVGHAARPT